MKLIVLLVYFAVLIGIGLYCRRHATDVNGFVLGGRSVGPWLTAFAYGTSYFSAVIFGRLRRSVRLEIRHRFHVDWHRQRAGRFAARLGRSRTPHAHHDATLGLRNNARLLRLPL